jgi:hypothetical protein
MSAELNRPFADTGEPPFRPFLIRSADGRGCHFGVVYQHWIADSVAVRRLLQRWVERVFAEGPVPPIRFRHADQGYVELARLTPGDETPGQAFLSLLRRHLRYRRVRKVQSFGEHDYPVAVSMSQAIGLVPRLAAAARRHRAKFNDLLLAAAARACEHRVPTQRRGKRQDVALGSIVDLRPLARGALEDRFGLFLGFAEVVCRPKEVASPQRLIQTIARQSQLYRRRGIWTATTGWLMAALATRPLVPPRNLYRFFRKETPIVAGVSNVNLNTTWVAADRGLIGRYLRISPTGPLAPIVFSVTTLGEDLQLSLTYRAALLNETQARELGSAFIAELDEMSRS